MEIPRDDSFMEIISLLRKRDKLCREWSQDVNRRLREGTISYGEWERQSREIEAELTKTKEAIDRLDSYLKNVKVNGK